jgi:hypothetical protein
MSSTSELAPTISSVFDRPHGVVGIVDDLLQACPEEGIRLEWRKDCCHVRTLVGGAQENNIVPLRKSVFRAVLARLAALCTEPGGHSVSPYGGHGKLSIGTDSSRVFRVSFANTVDQQWIELRPIIRTVRFGLEASIMECLEGGPKSFREIRRALYDAEWDIRPQVTCGIINEMITDALIEVEEIDGEPKLVSRAEPSNGSPTAA